MRKVYTILIVLLYSTIFADPPLFIGEFSIDVNNNSSGKTITLAVTLVSDLCWDASPTNDDYHPLTSSYHHSNAISSQSTSSNDYVRLNLCYVKSSATPYLGLGRYKISVREDGVVKDYMYIDYRTSDLPEGAVGGVDIEFDYNASTHKLYYDGTTTDVTSETIWNMRGNVDEITMDLQPCVPNNFSLTEYNNHPKLTWNHCSYPYYVEDFDIYRSFSSPHSGFSIIATTSSLQYIDNEVHVGPGGTVYYKVKAINGVNESSFTSVESINYDGIQKRSNGDIPLKFELSQNYPNPFNPSTVIKYQIPKNEFVRLVVYNSLGEGVDKLVYAFKERGSYSVEFNTKNLPSGIYFYRLDAGTHSSTKKMMLLR